MRSRRALLLGVVAVACVRTSPAPSGQRHLRVMTYNIQSGGGDLARVAGAIRALLARLHDTWPASAGPGFTYPATAPAKRIDYVLTSPDFGARHVDVAATEASDHRPLVVDLRMN